VRVGRRQYRQVVGCGQPFIFAKSGIKGWPQALRGET